MPLISVLIPSYNRPELLVSTIRSALAQDGCDFEVIVSDDASPRGPEVASAVEPFKADSRFQYIAQPQNLGWSDNRNALVAEARGDFVLLLGDDDLLPSGALARLAAHVNSNPDCKIAAFGFEVIDPEGRHVYSRHVPGGLVLQVGRGDGWREVFYYDVLPSWGFHPFTLCCHRSLPRKFPYDRRCGIGDDVLFLYQVLDAGIRIDVLPDILLKWRRTLKEVRGYINLSSSQSAQDIANRSIWQLSQSIKWISPAVRELVGSAEFARNFLGVPPDLAAELSRLGRAGTSEDLSNARELCEGLSDTERWQATKLTKLNRMRVLGGLKYSWFGIASTLRAWHRTGRFFVQ